MPRTTAMTETEIRSLARSYSRGMLSVLVGVARQKSAQPGARVAAANSVLDRGWGKAEQMHSIDGDIKVTIRHILEHIDEKPVIIDGTAVLVEASSRCAKCGAVGPDAYCEQVGCPSARAGCALCGRVGGELKYSVKRGDNLCEECFGSTADG